MDCGLLSQRRRIHYELYARKGEVVRIRLNPTIGAKGKMSGQFFKE